jgi:hypothetical protein
MINFKKQQRITTARRNVIMRLVRAVMIYETNKKPVVNTLYGQIGLEILL